MAAWEFIFPVILFTDTNPESWELVRDKCEDELLLLVDGIMFAISTTLGILENIDYEEKCRMYSKMRLNFLIEKNRLNRFRGWKAVVLMFCLSFLICRIGKIKKKIP